MSARRSPRVAMTTDSKFLTPTSIMARRFAIWASRPRWMPPLTTRRRSSSRTSSAIISAMASQSRGARYRLKRSYTRLAGFSGRGAVCLVEDFEPVDHVAVDRQKFDKPPFGVEALLRFSRRRVRDDRPEIAQPMHSFDVGLSFRCELPPSTDIGDRFAGRERCSSAVIDIHPLRRRRGNFVPVDSGGGFRDDRPRLRVGGRFADEVPGIEILEGGVDVVDV